MTDWRPGAPLGALTARAKLLGQLRQFFAECRVLEVETPLLASCGITDPSLAPLTVPHSGGTRYLQTSPEYAMKRLLAAGSGDIFQICKAFRADEIGRRHNPEYSILEWYRLGLDHRELAREVARLVCQVLDRPGWQVWSYQALFAQLLDVNPFTDPQPRIEAVARRVAGDIPEALDRDSLLDLLMSHAIEPRLADWGVVIVTDYPPSQAALARTDTVNGVVVGCRFECYVDGVELANGYWELGDVAELRRRFEHDNVVRAGRGAPVLPLDEAMLAAHAAGLPDCAGVALGVDRLLALAVGGDDIRKVLAFDWQRS